MHSVMRTIEHSFVAWPTVEPGNVQSNEVTKICYIGGIVDFPAIHMTYSLAGLPSFVRYVASMHDEMSGKIPDSFIRALKDVVFLSVKARDVHLRREPARERGNVDKKRNSE